MAYIKKKSERKWTDKKGDHKPCKTRQKSCDKEQHQCRQKDDPGKNPKYRTGKDHQKFTYQIKNPRNQHKGKCQ